MRALHSSNACWPNGSRRPWWWACPIHPDGAAHENTHKAQRFARQLHGRFRLPVHEVDERYTTTEAHQLGARDADAAAAALILDQYFRDLPTP